MAPGTDQNMSQRSGQWGIVGARELSRVLVSVLGGHNCGVPMGVLSNAFLEQVVEGVRISVLKTLGVHKGEVVGHIKDDGVNSRKCREAFQK